MEQWTALLIARAWVEEGSSQPLRVELRLTTDVLAGIQQYLTLSDIELVCQSVRAWLLEVTASS